MSKEKIFKGHYNLASGKQADEMVVRHMTWVLNAMQEYADQQTKALTDEIDQLNKDYSILNDQFVKSKEWNLEIVYSNKFKDKEIKQLQARIDELEKALKESVIVLNGVDFSLFYKDEEEKANKLINKIYQLTEPTNK